MQKEVLLTFIIFAVTLMSSLLAWDLLVSVLPSVSTTLYALTATFSLRPRIAADDVNRTVLHG